MVLLEVVGREDERNEEATVLDVSGDTFWWMGYRQRRWLEDEARGVGGIPGWLLVMCQNYGEGTEDAIIPGWLCVYILMAEESREMYPSLDGYVSIF